MKVFLLATLIVLLNSLKVQFPQLEHQNSVSPTVQPTQFKSVPAAFQIPPIDRKPIMTGGWSQIQIQNLSDDEKKVDKFIRQRFNVELKDAKLVNFKQQTVNGYNYKVSYEVIEAKDQKISDQKETKWEIFAFKENTGDKIVILSLSKEITIYKHGKIVGKQTYFTAGDDVTEKDIQSMSTERLKKEFQQKIDKKFKELEEKGEELKKIGKNFEDLIGSIF